MQYAEVDTHPEKFNIFLLTGYVKYELVVFTQRGIFEERRREVGEILE